MFLSDYQQHFEHFILNMYIHLYIYTVYIYIAIGWEKASVLVGEYMDTGVFPQPSTPCDIDDGLGTGYVRRCMGLW